MATVGNDNDPFYSLERLYATTSDNMLHILPTDERGGDVSRLVVNTRYFWVYVMVRPKKKRRRRENRKKRKGGGEF